MLIIESIEARNSSGWRVSGGPEEIRMPPFCELKVSGSELTRSTSS